MRRFLVAGRCAREGIMRTDTSYLGLALPHPFVAGASPFGYYLDTVKRLEDAGWAAVVLHSLFAEQITGGTDPGWFPGRHEYPLGPDEYAEHITRLKQAVRIPVIGSLNGTSTESWIQFAKIIEEAGADAIEMNLYEVVTDPGVTSSAIEQRLCGLVTELTRVLAIPVAVKLSPFFAAFANIARRVDEAGAGAIVLFNRFYQPDIDTTSLQASPHVQLSTSDELLLRLRWLAILYGHVHASLTDTGGVALPNDGVKAILAGADAVQMTSALLRNGAAYVTLMRRNLEDWMEEHGIALLDEMRGLVSLQHTNDPAAFERANYIRSLQSWHRHQPLPQ
jgi:dihydroorotate dehydrogenase (fumarate)